MPPGFHLNDVTVRFGAVTALDNVTLTVVPGTVMALVGESGSGKSTLLRCLNRTVTPQSGTVLLDAVDVRSIDTSLLRRRMGYVPQSGGLVPHWTIERNAALVPTLIRHPKPLALAHAALERCGLPAPTFGARWPHQLSGGQRQRAAIARALAAEQDVLLLDEAFSALDAISRDVLLDNMATLLTALRPTTIMVTHDIGEAARLADRVAVVRAGRIEQCATLDELRQAPATPYVAELLQRAESVARRVIGR